MDIVNSFLNEHAARIATPNLFVSIVQLQKLPNGIRILGGPLKSDPQGSGKPQSYRFPKDKFTPAEARTWLKDNDIKFILFEPASTPQTHYQLYEDLTPKYIQNVSKERAEINLFEEIGMGGISGQAFADEIQMLNEFGVKEIHVNINSPGGSVMDGLSIFAAIKNSKADVHTHIEVAISMAGVIAMAGDKITMVDHGKLMIHNPSGSHNPDDKEQNALDSLRDSLLIIFKNRTKVGETRLSQIMDEETWLTPKEALADGFIDEIISGKHKDRNKKRQAVAEIVNILNIKDNKNMKSVTKLLGLNEDATEVSIVEAIQSIQNELAEAKDNFSNKENELTEANKTISDQKNTITQFEDKQKELNKAVVVETVEAAVKDGKFDEKDKDDLVKEFENNHTGLKMIVGKLRSPAQIITNQLKAGGEVSIIPEDKKDWSLRKFEKEAPEIFNKILENKELHKRLYKAEYNVELN